MVFPTGEQAEYRLQMSQGAEYLFLLYNVGQMQQLTLCRSEGHATDEHAV